MAAEEIMTTLDATLVVPFIVDPRNAHLNGVGAVTRSEPGGDMEAAGIFRKVRISLTDEHSIAAAAFREQKPIISDNAREDPMSKRWLVQLTGVRSVMAVPIERAGESIGVIIIGDSRARSFTVGEVGTASNRADQLGREF